MTNLLNAFSRNWTGLRSSTFTSAATTVTKVYRTRFRALTPLLVAHGEDTNLWETSQECVFQRLAILIHKVFFPFRETIIFGWAFIGLLTWDVSSAPGPLTVGKAYPCLPGGYLRQYVSSSTTTRTGSLEFALAFLRSIRLSESAYILVDSREAFAVIILK